MPKTICALGIKISKAGLGENFKQALVPIWILLKRLLTVWVGFIPIKIDARSLVDLD